MTNELMENHHVRFCGAASPYYRGTEAPDPIIDQAAVEPPLAKKAPAKQPDRFEAYEGQ